MRAAEAHHLGGGQRFHESRQRARASRALGTRSRTCPHDAAAGSVGSAFPTCIRAAELLRVSRGLMEPWDGPAALAFSDGVVAGSALDRNGLGPAVQGHARTTSSSLLRKSAWSTSIRRRRRVGPARSRRAAGGRYAPQRRLRSADAKLEVAQRCPYRRWSTRVIRQLRPRSRRSDPRSRRRAGRAPARVWLHPRGPALRDLADGRRGP